MSRKGSLGGNGTRSHCLLLDGVLRLPLMVLVLSCLYAHTDSETSHYTWRLDGDKVMPGAPSLPPSPSPSSTAASATGGGGGSADNGRDNETADEQAKDLAKMQEEVLEILLSTETAPDGTWKKTWSSSRYCSRCQRHPGTNPDAAAESKKVSGTGAAAAVTADSVVRNNRGLAVNTNEYDDNDLEGLENAAAILESEVLDCGKPVNFTYYDHLVGIQNRADHPHIPEPEVALTFQKDGHFIGGTHVITRHKNGGGVSKSKGQNGSKSSNEINIDEIERALKKAKREKPKSVELYNRIGNFWRIRGDTQKTIECFRRALAVSPNNADILLNLARVLFNLQYLDDAIVLTRRSLEVQPPDQNAWAQHFQLGEILKAYCHYQEAALHLRHVLELKPNYGPALSALADMEAIPDTTVHLYTVVIIVFLVMAVLLWVLSTLDIGLEELLGFTLGTTGHSSSGSKSGGDQDHNSHNKAVSRHLQKLRNSKRS